MLTVMGHVVLLKVAQMHACVLVAYASELKMLYILIRQSFVKVIMIVSYRAMKVRLESHIMNLSMLSELIAWRGANQFHLSALMENQILLYAKTDNVNMMMGKRVS